MESVKKNWGVESLWVNTKLYSSRLFVIVEGQSTQKQFLRKQDKTILVLQGIVQLTIEGTNRIINQGETYHILPKIIHQLTAIKGDVTIIEVGTEFIESDVVKIEV